MDPDGSLLGYQDYKITRLQVITPGGLASIVFASVQWGVCLVGPSSSPLGVGCHTCNVCLFDSSLSMPLDC